MVFTCETFAANMDPAIYRWCRSYGQLKLDTVQ